MMKLTVLGLLIGLLHVHATGLAQQVSISKQDASLKAIFDAIHGQTGYDFIWSVKTIKSNTRIDVDIHDQPIEEALTEILRGLPLAFEIDNKTILIHEKSEYKNAKAAPHTNLILAYAEVRGRVVDSLGKPLPGASVRVINADGQRTALQTLTDRDGTFLLRNVPEDARLEISFIGYITKLIPVRNPQVGDVILTIASSVLDETVVMAYGTTTRRLNTGNISQVTAEDIATHPVSNVLAALDGMVPGMLVTQSNGLPGAAFSVQVRGRTAIDQNITDDQPLFIIDGVPFAPNNDYLSQVASAVGRPSSSATYPGGVSPLSLINPQDIASIEVLKDADATAIYGSRGANGVILITTKIGSKQKETTRVDFQAYNGIGMVPTMPKMLTTAQYVDVRKRAFETDGEIPTKENAYDLLLWDTTYNNQFNDLIFGANTHNNNYQLSVSGGTGVTNFQLSGNYNRQTNMYAPDRADKRVTFHTSLQHRSKNDRLRITFSGNYSSNRNNQVSDNVGSYLYMSPNQRFYNEDGSLAWEQEGITIYTNPIATKLHTDYLAKSTAALGNLLVDFELVENLRIKASAGYNNVNIDETSLRFSAADNNGNRFSYYGQKNMNSWIIEPQLEYKRDFGESHINLLAGGTWQENGSRSTFMQASGFTSDALMNSVGNATSIYTSQDQSAYRYAAGFARATFHYDRKYLVNASIRRDGSSRFGPGKQLATFSALGLGWIFSSEKWVQKNISVLSFGKIRGSYGVTGNDKISEFQYLDTWQSGRDIYGTVIGLYPYKLFNPDYRWERTVKTEAGIELGFLKDRVLLSASYYQNSSSNQLVNYRLPLTTGFNAVTANLDAKVVNKGWEFILNTENISKEHFSWKSSFNISLPRNELVSFPGLETSPYYSRYVVGQPLSISYTLYQYKGVDPQTGLYEMTDVNQDGNLTSEDRTQRLSMDATLFGGFKNNITYRRFNLDFLFSFRKQIAESYVAQLQVPGMMYNLPEIAYLHMWKTPGDQALIQRPTQSFSSDAYNARNNFHSSTGAYSNASYIRLRNVSIGYNFQNDVLPMLHISNARLYIQAENLFLITPYEVGDPEVGAYNVLPPLRRLVFGIQIGL